MELQTGRNPTLAEVMKKVNIVNLDEFLSKQSSNVKEETQQEDIWQQKQKAYEGYINQLRREKDEAEYKWKRMFYIYPFLWQGTVSSETATWNIIEGDGTEDAPDMLCLEIDFGMGDGLHEDTAYLEAEPSWEVNFYSLKIPADSLEPGFCLEQPNQRKMWTETCIIWSISLPWIIKWRLLRWMGSV